MIQTVSQCTNRQATVRGNDSPHFQKGILRIKEKRRLELQGIKFHMQLPDPSSSVSSPHVPAALAHPECLPWGLAACLPGSQWAGGKTAVTRASASPWEEERALRAQEGNLQDLPQTSREAETNE